jgi:hypothetical protein
MRPFRKLLVVFLFCLVGIGLHWLSASSPGPDMESDNVNVSADNGAESDVLYDTKDRFL